MTYPSHSTKVLSLPPWSREQIREARKAQLAPLIAKRGLVLVELPADNVAVTAFPGLIVKGSYWRWPERDQAGNTIDFFVLVLGLSFHDAMKAIVES